MKGDHINRKTLYLRPAVRRIMVAENALRGNSSQWLEDTLLRHEAMLHEALPKFSRKQWATIIKSDWAKEWSSAPLENCRVLLLGHMSGTASDHPLWSPLLALRPAESKLACIAMQHAFRVYFVNEKFGPATALAMAGM